MPSPIVAAPRKRWSRAALTALVTTMAILSSGSLGYILLHASHPHSAPSSGAIDRIVGPAIEPPVVVDPTETGTSRITAVPTTAAPAKPVTTVAQPPPPKPTAATSGVPTKAAATQAAPNQQPVQAPPKPRPTPFSLTPDRLNQACQYNYGIATAVSQVTPDADNYASRWNKCYNNGTIIGTGDLDLTTFCAHAEAGTVPENAYLYAPSSDNPWSTWRCVPIT